MVGWDVLNSLWIQTAMQRFTNTRSEMPLVCVFLTCVCLYLGWTPFHAGVQLLVLPGGF
jgi:hypothetical protein